MGIQTWSPSVGFLGFGSSGVGATSNPSGLYAKPAGDGWEITGYTTKTIVDPLQIKNGPIINTVQIPIYSKLQTPDQASSPASTTPAPSVTPAQPIELPTKSRTDSGASDAVKSADPVVQDFKLAEQAAAQKSYLDDTLTKRMEKFQNLLSSLSL